MKVTFLQKDSFVKLAIEHLSAVLKENGHECDLFIASGERNFLESAVNSGADLFAFSCTTGGQDWVLETASALKKRCEAPVIVGGPHTTFYPQMVAEASIDFICRGEGDQPIVDLLDALKNDDAEQLKAIPNIWYKDAQGTIYQNDVRDLIGDLDILPHPDFDIYSKYRYMMPYNRDMFAVITGRGCPFKCSYCFNKSLREIYKSKGTYLRRKSPQRVIDELVLAKQAYGIKKINFVDDSFLIFPGWVEEFAALYKQKVGLPFIINAEPTHVTEKMVRIVKEMGCICFRMGVETGNDHLRQTILNKKVTSEQIKEAAKHIKHYKIKLVTYNILGLPGETVENAMETYKLNREIKTDFIQCTLLQPYPGTALGDYVRQKKLLKDNSLLQSSCFVSTSIKLENENEIINLQKLLQIFLQMHIPLFLIRGIIKLPKNPLFSLIFKLSFIYNKIRTQKIRLIPVFVLGLHSLSYMKEKKTGDSKFSQVACSKVKYAR